MQHNNWKRDQELLAEAYNKYIFEEGVVDFFKGFSRKLFNKTKDKYEGFDDELIEDLSNRLRAGGPEAVEAFLDVVKTEAGDAFEGAVSSSASKILKALRYGVDTAVSGVVHMIYELIDAVKEGAIDGYRGENEETDSVKDLKPGDHIDKIVDNYKTYQIAKNPKVRNNAALNIKNHSETLTKWVETAALTLGFPG